MARSRRAAAERPKAPAQRAEAQKVHAGTQRVEVARELLGLVRGDWLVGAWTAEAKRFVPSLLIGLYVADLEGRRLSKREASLLMNADPATSGPKYIRLAEERGLLRIIRRPAEDKRKDFLEPTAALRALVEAATNAIGAQAEPTYEHVPESTPNRGQERASIVPARHYVDLKYDWLGMMKPLSSETDRRDAAKHEMNLTQRIDRNPDEPDLYTLRSVLRRGLGRTGEAIADLNEAIKRRPTNGGLYASRGKLLLLMGRLPEGIADIEKADALGMNDFAGYDAIAALALAYRRIGDEQRAEAALSRLQPHPDTITLESILSTGGAEHAIEAATGLGTTSADQQASAVRPYLKLMQDVRPEDLTGDERKSGERHEKMLSDRIIAEPENAQLYCYRGEVRRTLGRVGEAIADVSEAIKLNPSNGTFYLRRGQWLLLMGRVKEGTADLERGVELGLKDYEEHAALTELDRAYAVLGDEERRRATKERLSPC